MAFLSVLVFLFLYAVTNTALRTWTFSPKADAALLSAFVALAAALCLAARRRAKSAPSPGRTTVPAAVEPVRWEDPVASADPVAPAEPEAPAQASPEQETWSPRGYQKRKTPRPPKARRDKRAARRTVSGPRLVWRGEQRILWSDLALVLCLGLALCTTFSHHGGYYFLSWPLGEKTLAALLRSRVTHLFLLSAAAAVPFLFVHSRRWIAVFLGVLFVGAELLCVHSLLDLTDGWAVYSDDHPSFLFRIQEFWHAFPWRENYVPHWNAGVVNSVLTSSGVPGYALLTAPLRAFFHAPHEYHTYGLLLVHVFLAPWLTLWAFRACGAGWRGAWTGALLHLCASRSFFLWTFHFGTVGAGVSWAMTPAAFLFLYALAERRRSSPHVLLGLVLSMTFLCLWPQMWLFAALLALAALTSWRRWTRTRRLFLSLVLCAAAVALLLAPSIVSALGAKDLIQYTTAKPAQTPLTAAALWTQFLRHTSDLVLKLHPLALVLGLAGVWTLPHRALRRWFAIAALGVVALYTIGTLRAPNLQLHRVVIPLGFLAIVPATLLLTDIWRERRSSLLPLQAVSLALLVLGASNTAGLYRGKGVASFRPLPPFVQNLSAWVSENVPEGSRLAFAGRTIHTYGRGHVAYLPILAGREMMACDYYEFPPGTYEADFPPRAARSQPGGLHAYLVRHGVSHVITCRPNYLDYFSAHPEAFTPEPTFENDPAWGSFRVFRVQDARGVFLEGSGHVAADFNRLSVTFDGPEPPERAVLAYHWHERLVPDAPAEIAPVPTGTPGEAPFLEIRPHGARSVTLRFHPRH